MTLCVKALITKNSFFSWVYETRRNIKPSGIGSFPWAAGNPSFRGRCLLTVGQTGGKWEDDRCDRWGWTICEFPPCPQGWVGIGNSCYNFQALDATFDEAVEYCNEIDAKVVEPKNAAEDKAIFDKLDMSICEDPEAPQNGCYQYWLGVTMDNASER